MYNYAQALSLPGALAICPPLRVVLPLIGRADIRGRGSMQSDSDRVRADLDAIGMRASGSAVGLLQLLKELLDARVLGHDAVERIREAIIADVAGARPRSQTQDDFEKRERERMDHLLPHGPEEEAPISH